MKKALVIGAAGFVGKYLINCLHDEYGFEVFATKLPSEKIDNDKASVLDLNILEPEQILSVLNEVHPDYIFHLAAQSSVALSWKKPQLTVDINIKGAINLYETLRLLDFKPRTLVIGSGEEYGIPSAENPKISENTVIHPGNLYAATKACQNMIGSIYAKAYGLDIILVRAFNHIGPGQLEQFVVSDFCKQVAEIEKGLKEPVIHVGNLEAYRDFTDVRDVVRAYGILVQKGRSGETYNVGTGKAIQIRKILDEIVSQSSVKISVEIDPAKLRPIDVPKIEADTGKILAETGWKPSISVESTVKDTLEWWRNRV